MIAKVLDWFNQDKNKAIDEYWSQQAIIKEIVAMMKADNQPCPEAGELYLGKILSYIQHLKSVEALLPENSGT